jgi:hypothetical protein
MINKHDIEDWENKPVEPIKKTTGDIPLNPLTKTPLWPSIEVQIDSTGIEATITIGNQDV